MSSTIVDTRFMTKQFLTEFIRIYRQHPALWKTKSKEYSNKVLKNKGYDALVRFCKPAYPDADRSFVTHKIQNMRGCFRKEMKKVENSKLNAARDDDVYVPSLWYFDLFLFLKDQEMTKNDEGEECSEDSQDLAENNDDVKDLVESETAPDYLEQSCAWELPESIIQPQQFRRPTTPKSGEESKKSDTSPKESTWSHNEHFLVLLPGIKSTDTSDSESNFRTPTAPKQQDTSTKETPNRKSKLRLIQQEQELVNACTDVLLKKSEMDEFDAVGFNIAAKLRKMNHTQQLLAEGLINKVVLKGLFNELTRKTDLTEPCY